MLQFVKKYLQIISNLGNSKWHQSAYIYLMYISYFLLAIATTGIIQIDPSYISILDTIVKYYVSIFLMARFNPLIETKFTKFDAKIAWSAGLFLFISTSAFQIIKSLLKKHIDYVLS